MIGHGCIAQRPQHLLNITYVLAIRPSDHEQRVDYLDLIPPLTPRNFDAVAENLSACPQRREIVAALTRRRIAFGNTAADFANLCSTARVCGTYRVCVRRPGVASRMEPTFLRGLVEFLGR